MTNYSENVLGLYFRKKDKHGNLSGGSFYYIAYGLKWKWLAYCAAIFCVFAAIGMSGVQTNKISGTISEAFSGAGPNAEIVKLSVGIIVAIVAAVIIIGGIQRIGRVTSMLVPFMSLLFIIMALIAICMHIGNIPKAFGLIFEKAFNFQAAGGGILGYSFAQVIKKGMARGVFSNEAGLGSSVIAHSASETKEPVKQGLWGIFEVFFDTFIICTLTSLTFLTTFDLDKLSSDMNDSAMSMAMFSNNFGNFGVIVFSIILPLFAFTTIIAWSYRMVLLRRKGSGVLFRRHFRKETEHHRKSVQGDLYPAHRRIRHHPLRFDLGDRRHLQRTDGSAEPDLSCRAQRSGGKDYQKLFRPQKRQTIRADALRLSRYEP